MEYKCHSSWTTKEGGKPVWGRKNDRKKKKKGAKPPIETERIEKKSINQCDDCIPAKCCMYFSVEIDKPEDMGDWNDMLTLTGGTTLTNANIQLTEVTGATIWDLASSRKNFVPIR